MTVGQTRCDYVGTECCQAKSAFTKLNITSKEILGNYDVYSVIQYQSSRCAVNGTETLVVKNSVIVPWLTKPNPSKEELRAYL